MTAYISYWLGFGQSPLIVEGTSKDASEQSSTPNEDDDAIRIAQSEQDELEAKARSAAGVPAAPSNGFKVPQLPTRSKQPESRQGEDDEDLDAPPQFPLPDSFQRSKAPAPKQTPPPVPAFSFDPPSPPRDNDSEPPSDLNIAVTPGTIPLGNMPPPPSTTSKPAFGMQDGSAGSSRKRAKVALGPGYSPLDWARLTQSGRNLRGVEGPPMKVTMEELKKHNTPYDAWTALDNIVYNITPYIRFHPGGQKELLRAAGRDGTKLFMLTHSWVNYQFMLAECVVGPLVKG